MNPEFRRQLWLHFSATRLVVLPVLLLACFAAVALSATHLRAVFLAGAGGALFIILVWGMGTLAAGASVIDELTERTWDQQRMSAMQPWAMTWGKLAGASAYGWYGGALCLLVGVPSAMLSEHRDHVLLMTLGAVLTGIFLPALLIAVNLQLVKVGGRMARRGGVWTMLLLVVWGLGPLLATLRAPQLAWWHQTYSSLPFMVASLAFFTLGALVAAWRSMAEVLAVRQLPWGWPTLALVLTFYLGGFVSDQTPPLWAVFGLATCIALTYLALLTEAQPRPLWQRVLTRLHDQRWRSALQELPRWPTTLLLALPFALWLTLTMDALVTPQMQLMDHLKWQPLCVVLLVLRDCALALTFAFSPNNKRPLLGFLVTMLVLYGLLPWLLSALHSPMLVGLVLPLAPRASLPLLVAALHLALGLSLLRWRWTTTAP